MENPSLLAWKSHPLKDAHDKLWLPRSSFFQNHGYTLWRKLLGTYAAAPNDHPRQCDGFCFQQDYLTDDDRRIRVARSIHYPARTADNRDVLITLLCDGTTGINNLNILRKLATGQTAGLVRNHVLPMLQELQLGNLVFGVFPLVGPYFGEEQPASIYHILDAMTQIFEGLVFIHDRHIAHQDLFSQNILSSIDSGSKVLKPPSSPDTPLARYYFIDFEWAVDFSTAPDASSRTVYGPPIPWKTYRRLAPPEMSSGRRHCPFKADVWQLGRGLFMHTQQLVDDIPDIIGLLQSMMSADPDKRPTARAALQEIHTLRLGVPSHMLSQPPGPDWLAIDIGEEDEENDRRLAGFYDDVELDEADRVNRPTAAL